MYLMDTLYYIYKPIKRKDLMFISKKLSKDNGDWRIKIIIDMIACSLKYGCTWTEYGDLDFYYRNSAIRKTFITTFFNFKLYDKVNKKSKRNIFHDKILFLEKFHLFVKRDWININAESHEKVKAFVMKHAEVVAKESHGDSGKAVEVINISDFLDVDSMLEYICNHNFNLLEEKIKNHPLLEQLNKTSLNTIRVVTVRNQKDVNILFAGIRIGKKGAKIDNISQGGYVARIDIDTGKIDSKFYSKQSSNKNVIAEEEYAINFLGYQLPKWNDVISSVKEAANVVPEISIVAWDIAITDSGIDFVEGNESFGSVIMQLYYKHNEEGLKPRLMRLL